MFVLGMGLGSVMRVLVIAVQNAVDYKDVGAATSGVTTFARSAGHSAPRFSARSSPAAYRRTSRIF
jgi:hypothetical protein